MSDKNSVTLSGRLVYDPQVSNKPDSTAFVKFRLASNDYYRLRTGEIREETTFVNCKCFGALAISLKGLKKGEMLVVDGRLVIESWEHDGTTRQDLVVLCESVREPQWVPRPALVQSTKADHPKIVDEGHPPF